MLCCAAELLCGWVASSMGGRCSACAACIAVACRAPACCCSVAAVTVESSCCCCCCCAPKVGLQESCWCVCVHECVTPVSKGTSVPVPHEPVCCDAETVTEVCSMFERSDHPASMGADAWFLESASRHIKWMCHLSTVILVAGCVWQSLRNGQGRCLPTVVVVVWRPLLGTRHTESSCLMKAAAQQFWV